MSARHEQWFGRADDDIAFARVGLKEEFFSQVCFLSQQAAEKTLKGLLVAHRRMYPKSHDLPKLAERIPGLDLGYTKEELKILSEYYLPVRYPDMVPGATASGPPPREAAQVALEMAVSILAKARAHVRNL